MKSRILLFTLLFSFCLWLMFESFSYKDHTFYIADHVIYDFAVHIPLVRSFSYGENFPPQYPLFPGEPIRYHFLFYSIIGMLEKTGLPIDWALNIPSALGLFTLIITLYLLTKKIFQRKLIAILTVIFFLFNGSLTFIKFFQNQPFNFTKFTSFGPFDGGEIAAFWNLSTFTNQRHFAWGLALGLLFILTSLNLMKANKKIQLRWAIIWGIGIGLLPFFHQSIMLILAIIIILYFLIYTPLRLFLVTTGLISSLLILPQLYFFSQSGNSILEFFPGYLIHGTLTPLHFFTYWFKNLGLHMFLIPIGIYLAPKDIRKLLTLPLLIIFLIPNLIRFSPEVATNHKFFNFALILGSMFSAFCLVRLWDMHRFITRAAFVLIFFFLTLSGIVDLFPLVNASQTLIDDAPKNQTIDWFLKKTEPDAIILNSSYVFHPASLAGRRIFLGWPMYAESAGYNVDERFRDFKAIWENNDIYFLCSKIKEYHISYVMYEKSGQMPQVNPKADLFNKYFPILYKNSAGKTTVYDVRKCDIP